MNTQAAIEKVLQDFSKELLKVFSAAVVQAVSQVGSAADSKPVAALAAKPAAKVGRPKGAVKADKPEPRRRGRPPSVKTSKPAKPAKTAKPAKVAGSKRGPGKSTPEEVERLGERILDVLRRADHNLTSKEIMKGAGMRPLDEGRFNYAFNKLKTDGDVIQHGERRMARYGLGGKKKRARKGAEGAESPAAEAVKSEG